MSKKRALKKDSGFVNSKSENKKHYITPNNPSERASVQPGNAAKAGGNGSRLCNHRECQQLMKEYELEAHRKSVAISEMLSALELEKEKLASACQENMELSAMPLLDRIKQHATAGQIPYIQRLEQTLRNVASPFLQKLRTRGTGFTSRELEICTLIKQGMSSKDIARYLSTSEETVRAQRKAIRRKLGIANKKTSLRAALQQL